MTRFDPHVARSLLRYELKVMCGGVSHEELGARLGVSRASFSQAIAAKNLFSKPALEVLANRFDQQARLPYLLELLEGARQRRGAWSDRSGAGLAEGLRLTARAVVAFDVWTVNPAVRAAASGVREPVAAVTWFAEECVLHRLRSLSVVDRLITLAESGALTPRIVPGAAEPVPGLWNGFAFFDRDDGRAVVAERTNRGYRFADEIDVVGEHRQFIRELDSRAWDTERSLSRLMALRAGLGTGVTASAQPVTPVPD